MKILLLNPPFTLYWGIKGHGGKTAPINLAYLAAYLSKYSESSHQIEILDAEGLLYGFETIENKIKEISPDVVALTMTTPTYKSVKTILESVKKIRKSTVTIVGGAHPSAFPTELLDEIPQIDFSIVGEGELPFKNLINALDTNQGFENIKGLVYRNNNKIICNSEREYISDINTIPFPARDLLPMDIYCPSSAKDITHKGGFTNIFTSRGCPHKCTYCSSNNIWRGKVRLRSAQNVVDEIESCYKSGITRFNFNDDIFPINKQRTIDICNLIRSRNLDIRWTCMTRADFVWPDVMTEMKNAGCETVNLGLESGSDEILKSINKKTTSQQGINAVKICKEAGLEVMGNFMIGNMSETEETIKETAKYAKMLDLDSAGFFIAMPYPGTQLFTEAIKRGYMREDWSYEDMVAVGDNKPPMILPDLSPERLRYWQARAMREFYLRPKFIFKTLKKIRSLRDVTALIKGLCIFMNIWLRMIVKFGKKNKSEN